MYDCTVFFSVSSKLMVGLMSLEKSINFKSPSYSVEIGSVLMLT